MRFLKLSKTNIVVALLVIIYIIQMISNTYLMCIEEIIFVLPLVMYLGIMIYSIIMAKKFYTRYGKYSTKAHVSTIIPLSLVIVIIALMVKSIFGDSSPTHDDVYVVESIDDFLVGLVAGLVVICLQLITILIMLVSYFVAKVTILYLIKKNIIFNNYRKSLS